MIGPHSPPQGVGPEQDSEVICVSMVFGQPQRTVSSWTRMQLQMKPAQVEHFTVEVMVGHKGLLVTLETRLRKELQTNRFVGVPREGCDKYVNDPHFQLLSKEFFIHEGVGERRVVARVGSRRMPLIIRHSHCTFEGEEGRGIVSLLRNFYVS